MTKYIFLYKKVDAQIWSHFLDSELSDLGLEYSYTDLAVADQAFERIKKQADYLALKNIASVQLQATVNDQYIINIYDMPKNIPTSTTPNIMFRVWSNTRQAFMRSYKDTGQLFFYTDNEEDIEEFGANTVAECLSDPEFVVQQAVGVYDTYAKMIYSGDILEISEARQWGFVDGTLFEVKWDKKELGWTFKTASGSSFPHDTLRTTKTVSTNLDCFVGVAVVGNIFTHIIVDKKFTLKN